MLCRMQQLKGINVHSTDGPFGAVTDVLFDDGGWTVRYLVARPEAGAEVQRYLLPVAHIERPDWESDSILVDQPAASLHNGPTLADDRPVSRQEEERLHTAFGWQPYWTEADLPREGQAPPVPEGDEMTGDRQAQSVPRDHQPGDPHLRSAREVIGYRVEGNDSEAGKVADFVLDDDVWQIKYLIVDTMEDEQDKQVFLAAHLVERVSFDQLAVFADLAADKLRKTPAFTPNTPLEREYEKVLQDYFGY